MFTLSSNIAIKTKSGKISFDYIADVTVTTDVETLTDTAIIKVPKKMVWKDKSLTDLVKKNDTVTISLGYDGENTQVFSGHVRKIKSGVPLEIECEDDMYLLKQVKVKAKHYKALTIKQLLAEYCPIAYDVPDVNLGALHIDQEVTLIKVLDTIRTDYSINFFTCAGKLYGALPSMLLGVDKGFKKHKFKFGHNTVPGDSLDYTLADDVKIIIKAKAITRDNKKIEVQEPEGDSEGEVRTFLHPSIESKEDLKKFAKEKLSTFKVDQMTGRFTVFGHPVVFKGDTIALQDDDNPERNDKGFFVKAVQYRFGSGGFRQDIELGMQIK